MGIEFQNFIIVSWNFKTAVYPGPHTSCGEIRKSTELDGQALSSPVPGLQLFRTFLSCCFRLSVGQIQLQFLSASIQLIHFAQCMMCQQKAWWGRAWSVGRTSHLDGQGSDPVPAAALAQWTWAAQMLLLQGSGSRKHNQLPWSTPSVTLKSVFPPCLQWPRISPLP